MIIDKFLDYFFENCVGVGVSLIKKHDNCKSDRQIVKEYANRYFYQKFDNLPLTEEFDFQPLQDFIMRELDCSIALSFHLPHAFDRKRVRDSIYLNAYAYSGADTLEKKKIVYHYMNMLLSILETFYLDRTENMILSNHTVDEMKQILEKAQIELAEVLKSIRDKLVYITTKIEYKNSFMEAIDRIKPKTYNNVPFHYLNPSIRFFGREAEMVALDAFRGDDRRVLFCILTGGGGSGKSRLMLEYVKSREYQIEWEFAFLTAEQGKYLYSFHEFFFDKNLFLIIDYAGSQVEEISNWLYAVCQCVDTCLPPRLRIVLIERQGVIYDDQGIEQLPNWVECLLGHGERQIQLKEIAYHFTDKPYGYLMRLRELSEDILWKIIRDYAGECSATWSDDVCSRIVDRAKDVSKLTGATPLTVLLMEDVMLNASPVCDVEYQELFDNAIKKWEMSWRQALCENNSELFQAMELLLIYSTATGRFSLEESLSPYYQRALDYLLSLEGDCVISVICGINGSDQFDGYINSLEPDLIGEYYFLEYIRRRRFQKKELERILLPLWSVTGFDEFLSRCYDDFHFVKRFQFLIEHNAQFLIPDSVLNGEFASLSLFLNNMVIKPYNKYFGEAMMFLSRRAIENPENENAVVIFLSMFNNLQKIYFDNTDSRKVPKIFYDLYQQANWLKDRYLDDENKMMVYSFGVSQLAKKTAAENPDFSLKLLKELVFISSCHKLSCDITESSMKAIMIYFWYNCGMEFLEFLPFVLQACCNLIGQAEERQKAIKYVLYSSMKTIFKLANQDKKAEELDDLCPLIGGDGFTYCLRGEEWMVKMNQHDFNNQQFVQTNFKGDFVIVQHLLEVFDALESGNISSAEHAICYLNESIKRDSDYPFPTYAYAVALFGLSNAQNLPEAVATIDRLRIEVIRSPQIPDLFVLLGCSLSNQWKRFTAQPVESLSA